MEKVSDALTVGFDTYPSATLDVMFGRFAPVGKLPLTLPKGDEVLAVTRTVSASAPTTCPALQRMPTCPTA